MSGNNGNPDIIVKRPAFQEMEEDYYPDPSTLPLPSQDDRIAIAEVTLTPTQVI